MALDILKFGVEFARSLFKSISEYSKKKKELASLMILAKANYAILAEEIENRKESTNEKKLANSYFSHCIPPILQSEKKKEKIYELMAIAYEYIFHTKERFHLEKVISNWDEFVNQCFIRLGYHLNKTIKQLKKEYESEINELEGKTLVEVVTKEEGEEKLEFKPIREILEEISRWKGIKINSEIYTEDIPQKFEEIKQNFVIDSGVKYDTDTSSGFYIDTRIDRILKDKYKPELPEEE